MFLVTYENMGLCLYIGSMIKGLSKKGFVFVKLDLGVSDKFV